jgi:hypothetical protein
MLLCPKNLSGNGKRTSVQSIEICSARKAVVREGDLMVSGLFSLVNKAGNQVPHNMEHFQTNVELERLCIPHDGRSVKWIGIVLLQ